MRREIRIDETRRSSRISLDGLALPQDALLASGAAARTALEHVERVALLLLSAEMAGGAEGVMQLTLEYLKTRVQFGRAIGSYQHLKHGMVEILCSVEQGRSLLYHAATAFDRTDRGSEIALRMAKAQLGESFCHAADRSIQFHGAIGFTYECHAQLYFRRAQWLEHAFGNARFQRKRLAPLLLDPA
jgi:alkylation response protein AidB-like acyl-CoA dehydrogenase